MVTLAVITAACTTAPATRDVADNINPHDLLTVDCLLPSQVRELGTQITYLAPRRAIRTSGARCALRGGEYVAYDRADFKSALAVWLPQAEQGDPEAQTYVGEIYEKGLGTRESYTLAALWYHRAVEQNYARAMINLGYLYESGLGVKRDVTRALNLYRQASGFTAAELEYVSSIEIANREATRQQAQRLDSEVTYLNEQIKTGNAQLKQQRKQLTNSLATIQHLRDSIAAHPTATNETHSDKQTNDDDDDKPSNNDIASQSLIPKPTLSMKQEQLNLHKADVELQQVQIEKLQDELNRQQAAIQPEAIEQITQIRANGPSINIIDPPVLLTRGSLMLATQTQSSLKLIGKIEPADTLFAFRINGEDQPVSATGIFQFDTSTTPAEHLDLLAVDDLGANTRLTLTVAPLSNNEVLDTSTSSSISKNSDTHRLSLNDVEFGTYHALVIGNDKYDNMSNLRTAGNGAIEVEQLLREKYGFRTQLLLNANQKTLLNALESIRATLGIKDNLVIYYAGHGELDERTGRGYWLPTDAKAEDKENWVANSAITAMIDTMAAKHVLIIADSCYSGAMSRSSLARPLPAANTEQKLKWLKVVAKSRVRTVLSSGGNQPVLDGMSGSQHSIFTGLLLEKLKQNSEVLEAYRLFYNLQHDVVDASAEASIQQVPQYAPLRHSGHQAGEFVFVPIAQNTVGDGGIKVQQPSIASANLSYEKHFLPRLQIDRWVSIKSLEPASNWGRPQR